MAMMLVERQRRPAFLLLLLAVSSRVATAAAAAGDGSFPSSRHKPPALPQAFVATVNTVATSCFVQCPSNCTGKNVVPSCPMPPDTFNTAQRAYNYHTNQTWKSTYQQGLRQNSSAITDCVSGLSFQLDPFRYPQPHQVCSGFPPGFSRPTMPASGLPLGSPGPFVIPAGASLLPNSSTPKVRNLPVRHWQYRAPFNSSVGGARPAGAGLYRWHVEDYYLDLHTGAPLRITLDESVHWLDHEYKNYTTWDRFSRDYMGLTPLRGAEATGLFDVSQLNCKLMLAPPPPSPLPAVPPAIPAAAAADAVHEQVAPSLAVSDGLLEHLRSLRRNGLVTWEASRSKRWGAGATVADVRATVGLPGFKAVGKVLGPASNDDTDVEHRSANTAALPSSWDIRTAHPECIWAKTIIDQGGCGSCWAWAAVGALASRLCMASNGSINVRLSPQYLVDCDTADEMGCGGGALDNVWHYLTDSDAAHGTVTEECYPYIGQDGGLCSTTQCKNRSASFHMFKAAATTPWTPTARATAAGGAVLVAEIQRELMEHGPVEAGIELFQDFAAYSSGVYTLTVNGSYGGGHAIEIIGWGTDHTNGTSTDYWTCQNTYGASWGESGYFRIRRGTNEIGIEQEVIAGQVPASVY